MAKAAPVQSDQLFRLLIEHTPDGMLLIAPDGTLVYANPAVTRLTGYTPDELLHRNSFALVHPGDLANMRPQLANLLAYPEETLVLACRVLCKDGSWRQIEGTALNLLENPQVGAIMCIIRDSGGCEQPLAESSERMARNDVLVRKMSAMPGKERNLRDAERKFRSFVDSNIVGVMVTDPEGRMYEVNGRLEQMLGYSQEELLNGSIRVKDLVIPAYLSARARAWKTLVSQGASLPEEKAYRRKDGSSFPALVTAATINQERTRALVMLLDISDQKDAERRKEEFLSMVSHELRTPLTIIQGFLELALFCVERLSEASSSDAGDFLRKLEEMLQQAQRQAELETRMVAELLDTSRMEMQRFAVALHTRNLLPIVQQVVANQQQMTPGRHIELVLPAQTAIPVAVDADRIDQVLTNYLTNAFKYSPAGQPVRVELSVEGCMARVSVSDQGSGLTEEQQEHVWDRFYQTEAAAQQGSGRGLGLGLYIVRTIIAQHQGQVGVESSCGQGATFWFMLPLTDEPIQSLEASSGDEK
jgi:PAS domain S-box-containing protein